MNPRSVWRALARPRVFLTLLLAAALLSFAFSLGNVNRVLARMREISGPSMLCVLGLAALYLVIKGSQLHRLLLRLRARMSWRRFVLALAVGELAATLPLGIFAQNWVLLQQRSMRFGQSSSATAFMLAMEFVVAVAWLAMRGIPGWDWLRPTAALLLAAVALMLLGLPRLEPLARRLASGSAHRTVQRILVEAAGLFHGLTMLCHWRALALNFVLSSAYLGTMVFAFVVVGHAMGVGTLRYFQAVTIYGFALAVLLMGGGVVGQIGSMELLGMNAARAWNIGYADGLALMLGFRLVWMGAIWLLASPLVWSLRRLIEPDPAATPAPDDVDIVG
ncbi:MAG TPA: hypothetical protein VFF72_08665 [Caldimonas sp.]|nr:hypothetical protein [Caldimonas sp.]